MVSFLLVIKTLLLFFPFVLCIFLLNLILGQRSNKKKIGIKFLDVMHAQPVKKRDILVEKSNISHKISTESTDL